MNKTIPAAIFLLCIAFPATTFALTPPEPTKLPLPAIISSPKNSETLIFRGMIQKIGDATDTALYTSKAVYPLLGGDFTMIIGEEVNIIGKMVKEDNMEKIIVARIQFERE